MASRAASTAGQSKKGTTAKKPRPHTARQRVIWSPTTGACHSRGVTFTAKPVIPGAAEGRRWHRTGTALWDEFTKKAEGERVDHHECLPRATTPDRKNNGRDIDRKNERPATARERGKENENQGDAFGEGAIRRWDNSPWRAVSPLRGILP